MKLPHKIAYPALLGAFATTSCTSIDLPKVKAPSVPTFGLGTKNPEKAKRDEALRNIDESLQPYQYKTPAHLSYADNNGRVTSATLDNISRTSPLPRVKFWSEAYQKKPQDPQTILSFVRALREIKSYERATQIAGHGLVVHPNFAELKVEYGKALSSLGNTAKAVSVFQEAIATNPNMADAHAALGLAFERSGNSQMAQNAFAQALNLDPNRIETMSNYGMSLARSGNLKFAISLLARAHAKAPTDSKVRSNYALLLGMDGRYDEMRQVNAGTPQALAQKNESILREINASTATHSQNGYAGHYQNVGLAAQYGAPPLNYSASAGQYAEFAAPMNHQAQSTGLPYGAAAAREVLAQPGGINTLSNYPNDTNHGSPNGLGEIIATPSAYDNAPSTGGANSPYYPGQRFGFAEFTGSAAPTYSTPNAPATPTQPYLQSSSHGYGHSTPAQTGYPPQQLSVQPAQPSSRDWGMHANPNNQPVNPANLQMPSVNGMTGGFPYTAKSYLNNLPSEPDNTYSTGVHWDSEPPALKGFAY